MHGCIALAGVNTHVKVDLGIITAEKYSSFFKTANTRDAISSPIPVKGFVQKCKVNEYQLHMP